ncbi:MAG TPA: PP2C family serine/threonine-protein phosphatase [Thermomicrobiales bacterium]|nr:PP2C family serine/threonine-protein phosphatase [Thermomicrobiales bacterium]
MNAQQGAAPDGEIRSRTHGLAVVAVGQTDIGCQRQVNQDTLGNLAQNYAAQAESRGLLYAVADGMGGHARGEVASALAIKHVFALYYGEPDDGLDPEQSLARTLIATNTAVHEAGRTVGGSNMGTTLTTALFRNNRLYVGNIGDSRTYRVRGGNIEQLTHDHSLIGEQVRSGLLTEAEARQSNIRNVITRAVGYREEVEPDTFAYPVAVGDVILLCSDGLHGLVEDAELAHVLSTYPLVAAVRALIDLARERGGPDNITALAIRVDEVEPAPASALETTQTFPEVSAPGVEDTQPFPKIDQAAADVAPDPEAAAPPPAPPATLPPPAAPPAADETPTQPPAPPPVADVAAAPAVMPAAAALPAAAPPPPAAPPAAAAPADEIVEPADADAPAPTARGDEATLPMPVATAEAAPPEEADAEPATLPAAPAMPLAPAAAPPAPPSAPAAGTAERRSGGRGVLWLFILLALVVVALLVAFGVSRVGARKPSGETRPGLAVAAEVPTATAPARLAGVHSAETGAATIAGQITGAPPPTASLGDGTWVVTLRPAGAAAGDDPLATAAIAATAGSPAALQYRLAVPDGAPAGPYVLAIQHKGNPPLWFPCSSTTIAGLPTGQATSDYDIKVDCEPVLRQ